MKLVGMLDSPYVRRVAISLQMLGLPFEHQSLSVFRGYAEFARINPVVKAPTLLCDDGTVLMDSTLMLQYAEALAAPRSLVPREHAALLRELQLLGLALAACEKVVQHVYEQGLRPAEKQQQSWLDRVTAQADQAFQAIEQALAAQPLPMQPDRMGQAGLTLAVVWHFTRQMRPAMAPVERHPLIAAYTDWAEQLPEFRAAPHGDGTYPVH